MKLQNISVIIPAYNEEKKLQKTLPSIHSALNRSFSNFEIIVVDDGSYDGTYNSVLRLSEQLSGLKILRNEVNRGKGYSVKRGVLSAALEYILFTDADLSTPIEALGKFMEHLNEGVDIAIGSRAVKGSRIIESQSFLRRGMGKAFNMLVRLFLFQGVKDTQCGFKCFRREAARELFGLQRLDGFCFDAEILYIAKKKSYSIKEIPVEWANRKDSRVSMVKDSIKMFLDIFQVKLNDIRGLYDRL